jgi:hypothetical protein
VVSDADGNVIYESDFCSAPAPEGIIAIELNASVKQLDVDGVELVWMSLTGGVHHADFTDVLIRDELRLRGDNGHVSIINSVSETLD